MIIMKVVLRARLFALLAEHLYIEAIAHVMFECPVTTTA
jgi:hypothetical protein